MAEPSKIVALPPKQKLLLAAMLSGLSLEKAAEKSGLSYEWARELHSKPKGARFRAALAEAQEEIQRQAIEATAWTTQRCVQEQARIGDLAVMFGDWKAGIASRVEIARLLGLHAPKKTEHSGELEVKHANPVIDFSGFTEEELEEYAACQERLEAISQRVAGTAKTK